MLYAMCNDGWTLPSASNTHLHVLKKRRKRKNRREDAKKRKS